MTENDPGILAAPDALIEPSSRGDPMSPFRWTTKSTRNLGTVPTFFDPHVCSPPNISELAVPIEKSWACRHRGRRWVLQHVRSAVTGGYLGSSWILVAAEQETA